ncbi:Translation initiation factor 3 [hydrothermal vent metagenome]|uniref:Translation initiation factor 3 n=1 Tax=hydrothermal vent metagenome TaxID=652676 RepID=A0A3B0QXS6_9ZZZZ
MDYGKYKYQMSKKAHEAKKKQTVILVKEVKFRTRTDEHDFQFKLRNIKRFLGQGNKVKAAVFFRGREITHPEIGRVMLDRVIEDTKDIAVIEQMTKFEGRNMILILAPDAAIMSAVAKEKEAGHNKQVKEEKETPDKQIKEEKEGTV